MSGREYAPWPSPLRPFGPVEHRRTSGWRERDANNGRASAYFEHEAPHHEPLAFNHGEDQMKTFTYAAALAVTLGLLGGTTLGAQQPAPRQGPPAGAPEPQGQEMRRMPGPGPGFPGFAVMMFDPSRLLERRELLGLTADQVTKLSGLENDLKTARDKAQTDAKPHREELEKLLQGSAPDVAQVRTHAQALMQAEQGAQLATLATSVQ